MTVTVLGPKAVWPTKGTIQNVAALASSIDCCNCICLHEHLAYTHWVPLPVHEPKAHLKYITPLWLIGVTTHTDVSRLMKTTALVSSSSPTLPCMTVLLQLHRNTLSKNRAAPLLLCECCSGMTFFALAKCATAFPLFLSQLLPQATWQRLPALPL